MKTKNGELPASETEYEEPQEQVKPEVVVCLKDTYCFLIAVGLYALVLALMLISTLDQVWVRLGQGSEERLYGLFRLNSGPESIQHTTWNCLKNVACHRNLTSLCDTGSDMHTAASVFFALELFAFLFTILLIERFVYLTCKLTIGWGVTVYCLAVAAFVVQITGTIAWFGISGAQFDVDCQDPPSDPTAKWDICAEDSPKIAIAVIVLTVLVGVYACVAYHKRPLDAKSNEEEVGRAPIGCLQSRIVMGIWTLVLLGNLGLMIASLVEGDWVQTNGVQGSLYNYDRWEGMSNYGYDCIAFPNCYDTPDSGICKTFRDLTDANLTYLSFEIAALILLALWLQPTFHMIGGVEYGFPAANYTIGALCWLCHFVGTIAWFGVSQADFPNGCSGIPVDDRLKWQICAGKGPRVAVTNAALFCVSYPIWALIYYNRIGKHLADSNDYGLPEEEEVNIARANADIELPNRS